MSTQAKRPASVSGSESEDESDEEATKNTRVNPKAQQQQQQEPAKQQQAGEDEDGEEEESETDSDEEAGARYDTVKRDVYPGTGAAAGAKASVADYPAGKRGRDLNGGKIAVAEEPVNKKRKEFKGGEDKARAYAQPVRPSSPKSAKPEQVAKAATRGAAATRAEKAKVGPAGRAETAQSQAANRKVKAGQINSTKKGEVEKSSPVKGKKTAHWPNALEQSLVTLMYTDRRTGFVLPVSRGDNYWEKLLNRLPLEGEMTELQVVDKVKRMRNRFHALQRQFKEEGKYQFKNAHEKELYQYWEIIWGSGTELSGRAAVPHPAEDEESSEDESEGTPGEAPRAVVGQRKAEESSTDEEEEAGTINARRKTAGINQINAAGKSVATPFVSKPRLPYTPVHPMDTKRGGDIHSRDYHHEDGTRGDVTSPELLKQLRAETHNFFQEIRRNCLQLVEDMRGDKFGSLGGGLGGLSLGSLGMPDAFGLGLLGGTPAALQLQRRWGEHRVQELALFSERLQLMQEQCRLQQEELEIHNQKG